MHFALIKLIRCNTPQLLYMYILCIVAGYTVNLFINEIKAKAVIVN